MYQELSEMIFKVIVIGDPSVNKTKLLMKFCGEKFQYEYVPTVGVNITKERVTVKNAMGEDTNINLMIWDVAGQAQFNMLHRALFNGTEGIIFVYDITRADSFANLNNWYSNAIKYGASEVPKILVGIKMNKKSEYDRKIILPMAQHLSEKLNATHFEVSLDTGENVMLIFQSIAELMYRGKNNIGYGSCQYCGNQMTDAEYCQFCEPHENYCQNCGAQKTYRDDFCNVCQRPFWFR